MTCWVVVPVKAPEACKTRLAGTLDAAARAALVARMLGHVVGAARAAEGVDRVLLVGPSRHDLDPSTPLIPDQGAGLNPTLADALRAAMAEAVDRLILLPADLPQLTAGDVAALAALESGEVGIAPDRHGIGTNALSLPLPAAEAFNFAFGDRSFAAHTAEAARLGLTAVPIERPSLARDIDEPADLTLL